MVVIGAGGFAKELIDILVYDYNYNTKDLYFFDEINTINSSLYGFKILHSVEEVKHIFEKFSKDFCLGIGTPKARYNLCKKFEGIGGQITSVISKNSNIGKFNTNIEIGSCIMINSTISNDVRIGKGAMINADVLAGHDVFIGDFSDISPGVKITGHCQIGKFVTIGTGAVLLPKVNIGENSYIAAGSIIANDIPENSMVVGIIPSRVVSVLPKFEE